MAKKSICGIEKTIEQMPTCRLCLTRGLFDKGKHPWRRCELIIDAILWLVAALRRVRYSSDPPTDVGTNVPLEFYR